MKILTTALTFAALVAVMGTSYASVPQKKSAKAQHASATHRITSKQAVSAALKKCPGKVQGSAKLENEDGKWQYAVNVKSKKGLFEVMVDAGTGSIVNVEKTSKAEEAAEAKADAAKAHPKAKSHAPKK